MEVTIFTHAALDAHRLATSPERSERRHAVVDALSNASRPTRWVKAPVARRASVLQVHSFDYVAAILSAEPEQGLKQLDSDTAMVPGSTNAALRATGAVVDAVSRAATGKLERAFCAVRPPGHHAEPSRAIGFCLFNSVAIGAKAALTLGFERVAVIDFDVHHGNGTQAALQGHPQLFFGSIHQRPLWPGTGDPAESGPANIVNATVPPGAPRQLWRSTFEHDLMPALDGFRPDLILISAGFDAHRRDPLADQELEAQDFGWMTGAILSVARRHARGRVVSSLEGGYDLEALGQSAVEHVRALATG